MIRALLTGGPRTRVGLREVNIWPETLVAWLDQGYPVERVTKPDGSSEKVPADWVTHFGYDMARAGPGINHLPLPGYSEVMEETEEWIITRDGAGAAFKRWKHKSGTPEHVDFRMTSRAVWERDYRPHLLRVDHSRLDLAATRQQLLQRRGQGLWTYYQSTFVWENMRQTMGDVCMYESLVLDPAWILDFNRVYTDFYKAHYRVLFEEAGLPDGIRLCEDLGYKNGLFCSPRTLAKLIFPFYREIVDFFHEHGLIVELHSCGNVTQALPLIVEAGFDILNPMERKAGCDPLRFAEQYGDRLAFIGGLDVRVLESGDRELICREVTALIEGMKARGGRYVFGSDHSLTPLIAYRDYLYAVEVYREHLSY
jgi:uroporphyrinogen decarboxylase